MLEIDPIFQAGHEKSQIQGSSEANGMLCVLYRTGGSFAHYAKYLIKIILTPTKKNQLSTYIE